MGSPSLKRLPDDARLWVYGFEKKMDSKTRAAVAADLKKFVGGWTSHNRPVLGAFDIFEDRFVLIAGWCDEGLGGCSIDQSVGLIRSFGDRYGLDGLDRDLVFYRGPGGGVQVSKREDFRRDVEAGRLDGGTIVFDPTITTVGDLRAGRFETTFERCWHARVFAA